MIPQIPGSGNFLEDQWEADQSRKDDGDEQDHICNQCGKVLKEKKVNNVGDVCVDCRENEIIGERYGKI